MKEFHTIPTTTRAPGYVATVLPLADDAAGFGTHRVGFYGGGKLIITRDYADNKQAAKAADEWRKG